MADKLMYARMWQSHSSHVTYKCDNAWTAQWPKEQEKFVLRENKHIMNENLYLSFTTWSFQPPFCIAWLQMEHKQCRDYHISFAFVHVEKFWDITLESYGDYSPTTNYIQCLCNFHCHLTSLWYAVRRLTTGSHPQLPTASFFISLLSKVEKGAYNFLLHSMSV